MLKYIQVGALGWGNFLWSPTNRFNNGLVTITTNEVLYYFKKHNSLKLIKDLILRELIKDCVQIKESFD